MPERRITFVPRITALLSSSAASAAWIVIPLYAKQMGASNFTIGIIGMVYGSLYFISSYVFGNLADRFCRKKILIGGLLLSSFAFFLQIFAKNPTHLIMARAFCGFSAGLYPPSLISYVVDSKRPLGKFSSYLSLGWALGSYIAGVVGSAYGAFIASSALYTLAFLLSLLLPRSPQERVRLPLFPRHIIRRNLNVYLSYLVRHTGAHSVWIIFPILLSQYGITMYQIGIIFATNSIMQFIFMQISDRFRPRPLIITGFSFTALTFLIMYLSASFPMFMLSSITLGISWGSLYSGSIRYIAEINREIGTASGMLQSVISLAAVIGPFIGGTISQKLFLKASVIYAMVSAVVALLIFVSLEKYAHSSK